MIRTMYSTTWAGCEPMEVSPESINASAPSNTALATSLASALVGIKLVIMDSIIWVATTTGLQRSMQSLTMRFWIKGNCSIGNSTPKSPLAIITASDAAIMFSKSATADGFSIFDITGISCPLARISLRRASTSMALRTNERATQSKRCSKMNSKSFRSFSVRLGRATSVSGRFTPLRDVSKPPETTSTSIRSRALLDKALNLSLPSSNNNKSPGRISMGSWL